MDRVDGGYMHVTSMPMKGFIVHVFCHRKEQLLARLRTACEHLKKKLQKNIYFFNTAFRFKLNPNLCCAYVSPIAG